MTHFSTRSIRNKLCDAASCASSVKARVVVASRSLPMQTIMEWMLMMTLAAKSIRTVELCAVCAAHLR